MFTVHATKKLLDRIGVPASAAPPPPTAYLGNWYATALFWKPQVALFVNETTLLPVLVPLAPARTVAQRLPNELARLLTTLDIGSDVVDHEVTEMLDSVIAKTANRSVLGVMNEFAYLAGVYRHETDDLADLSRQLSETPCGPLYARHVSPDAETVALLRDAR